ncbi:MAG: ABC transporter ATP-binding protein [Victivallales bacterium]|jgi:iron(III) transport system ATP-binding protein
MTTVNIRGISKQYLPGNPVLLPLDLCVNSGELFFLLGPSGCGKSTLLRIIAGFVKPDSGSVSFDRQDITSMPPEKRQTAMVFQNYALWPHMTVYENVAFGLNAAGIKNPDLDRSVKAALETVQLGDFHDRKPTSLSGGQQQRVALARALAVNPRILLLDEPLSNLDARLRDSMRVEIRRICKERQLTAIYVTHDRKEALSMADRIAVIDKGSIQQTGTPEELYRRPANRFVASFLGECNFISGRVISNEKGKTVVETALGNLTSTLQVPDGNLETSVLIRPENILLGGNAELNSFDAVVESGMFLGETAVWNINSNGCRLTGTELGTKLRMPGDKCRFSIAPENVVIL